jgi:uncharacterized protein
MTNRNMTEQLIAALKDTPVVFLNGARQAGKSTLVKKIIEDRLWQASYITLDNAAALASAHADPTQFIAQSSNAIIIDEAQRVPELFLAIKEQIDRKRKPGQFLLTGSANVLLLPRVSDSLAGRMEIITLWPFSQGEIQGIKESFISALFSKELPPFTLEKIDRAMLLEKILLGGYPEVLTRSMPARRQAWFDAYVNSILQRDVRELANISGLTIFPKLLSLLATRASFLLNYAELSRASSIAHTTLLRYLTLLQTTFLVHTVPPWSNNLSKRLVKSPKLYLCDTGLLAHLLGVNGERLSLDSHLMDAIVENFAVMEIKKQLGWDAIGVQLFHYRTQAGQEVDMVLEDRTGRCVGIEVKASTTVTPRDFNGLRGLAEDVDKKFIRGIVLYFGDQVLSFGKNLYALPISTLWSE